MSIATVAKAFKTSNNFSSSENYPFYWKSSSGDDWYELNTHENFFSIMVVKSPSFLAILGQIYVTCCSVTMVTQNKRLLFFEVLWLGLLKNAFSAKSEKSSNTSWYILVRSIKKLVLKHKRSLSWYIFCTSFILSKM